MCDPPGEVLVPREANMFQDGLAWLREAAKKLLERTRDPYKRECLEAGIRKTNEVIVSLADLNSPRPPIHREACEILMLYVEGGLFAWLNDRTS